MRILTSFLILLPFLSVKVQSLSCDSALVELFQVAGAAVSEVTFFATFFNSLNFIVGNTCTIQNFEEISRNIARDEDRKQECQGAANILTAHEKTLREIKSYEDVKRNYWEYSVLRKNMRSDRREYFLSRDQYHECKFKLLTQWAAMELALIDIMIESKADKQEMAILTEAYRDALHFYIQKGSEMFSWFPMNLAHDGDGERAAKAARSAAKNLRPMLLEWIEAVEKKEETRKRLGLSSQPSDDPSQWSGIRNSEGVGLDKDYLPLKIEDGDWISLKMASSWSVRRTKKCGEYGIATCGYYWETYTNEGPTTWLSCHDSVHDSSYCSLRGCPGLSGYWSIAGDCNGETFEIQSTVTGSIEYGSHIALLYGHSDTSSRGEGYYWLSTYYGYQPDKLYTMPCVGSVFTEDDISSCENEVFTIQQSVRTDDAAKYLRNGDYVRISGIPNSDGFMMKVS